MSSRASTSPHSTPHTAAACTAGIQLTHRVGWVRCAPILLSPNLTTRSRRARRVGRPSTQPTPASPSLPRHAPVRPPTRRPHCALSPQPRGELAFVRASHSHSGERSAPRRAPEHPPPPHALRDFGALPAPPPLPTSSVESSITAAISDPPLHHTACSLARARPPCVCAPGLHATATAAAADASSSRGGGLGGGQRRCRREVWRRSSFL